MSVYVIGPKNGPYKIGVAVDVEKRFKNLQCANYEELVVHVTIGGGYALETFLHSYFEEKKIRGEWFDLDNSDLDFISTRTWQFDRTQSRFSDFKGRRVLPTVILYPNPTYPTAKILGAFCDRCDELHIHGDGGLLVDMDHRSSHCKIRRDTFFGFSPFSNDIIEVDLGYYLKLIDEDTELNGYMKVLVEKARCER